MKRMIIFLAACAVTGTLHATEWELKKDKDGIKVYTGTVSNSNLKAVRAVFTLNASMSQLTALLLDTKAHEQWVYNTKTSYTVKKVSANNLVYYSEVSMPWPLANRDVVVEMAITQQPVTKVLYVTANTAPGSVPVSKDKVRVPLSKVSWVVTPIGKNKLSVEYVAEADPGGEVPAWLVNSFTTKGPFETFKKLKELVTAPAYRDVHFDFVKD
ncbi:MAG: lipid-binding domain protein [Flavipsychrobacter sp.]|nr:lipid-binding domain protein [Flavipsychrobacter sp.]